MRITNFTVGADPELFIINKRTNKVVSSIGLIPGVKGTPYVAEDMPEGFGLETDNILAEFNIPPVENCQSFVNALNYMKSYIRAFVQKVNPDYDIKCSAYEIVDEDQLQSQEAKLFGCSPDYNAYTESVNPKPDGTKTNGRSAGFHIHLGYNDHNIDTTLQLIKLMDLYIGLPSLLYDNDKDRRSLYGKAGSFRLTPYGLEYRTLSSAMYNTDELMTVVWNGIIKSIEAYNRGLVFDFYDTIRRIIDTSDTLSAKRLIAKYKLI